MSKFIKIIAKTPKDNGFQNLLLRKRKKSSTEICTSTGPSKPTILASFKCPDPFQTLSHP